MSPKRLHSIPHRIFFAFGDPDACIPASLYTNQSDASRRQDELCKSFKIRAQVGSLRIVVAERRLFYQVAGLNKENNRLGDKLAAASSESCEQARQLSELEKRLAASEKSAEKLRQAVKKLERERDSRPLPEALVRI